MTSAIKKLIESTGAVICPHCNGEGEYESFCGHYTTEYCRMCGGNGVVKSLKKIKVRKDCVICNGRGCLGGCNHKGYREWETFEPLLDKDFKKIGKKLG